MEKDTYEDLDDIFTRARKAEAEAYPERFGKQPWMDEAIAADQARIENWDEEARIKAEAEATELAKVQARRERGRLERVMVEKRRLAAAALEESPQERYQPVLVAGRRSVRGIFDFDTWTWDQEAQFKLWEEQLKPTEGNTQQSFPGVLSPKEKLFNWYVTNLLPLIGRKAPSVWLVLTFLLRRAPDDLGPFKISHLGIATGTGLTPRSVQDALKYLKAWGLVLVVEEQTWKAQSKAGSSPAVYALVPVAKLRTPGNDFLV